MIDLILNSQFSLLRELIDYEAYKAYVQENIEEIALRSFENMQTNSQSLLLCTNKWGIWIYIHISDLSWEMYHNKGFLVGEGGLKDMKRAVIKQLTELLNSNYHR